MKNRIIPLAAGGFNEMAICRDGIMLYNRNDTCIGASLRKYGEWSAPEIDLFRQIVPPNTVVVEVGANIGAHTVALSRIVGPGGAVIALEPQRLLFQTLCANLALNSCANVVARQEVVGAAPGEMQIPVASPDLPNNFGALALSNPWPQGEPVEVVTIDGMNLTSCRLIKLDIKGMEAEALRGAADTIRRLRPALYVENEREDQSRALITLLLAAGYRLYWHAARMFRPDNFAGERDNMFGATASHNMLCVPREAAGEITGLQEITNPDATWRQARTF